jgi:hypothetical protein
LLELRELELLRELLATSTESAVKAKRKISRINRKSHVLAGPIRDLELSLYVSMTASFLLQNRKRAYAPYITGKNLHYRNKFSALNLHSSTVFLAWFNPGGSLKRSLGLVKLQEAAQPSPSR